MTGAEIIGGAGIIAGKVVSLAAKDIREEQQTIRKELVSAAKETPEFQQAARIRAKRIAIKEAAFLQVFRPIRKLLGLSTEYFEHGFEDDMKARLGAIPEENRTAPKASVAAPAMQGLAFSLEEPDLKELYLNLLASASDDRVSGDVHPAFVEVVRQLSAEEAPHLSRLLNEEAVACLRVKSIVNKEMPNEGWSPALDHVLNTLDADGNPTEVRRLPTFVDNWIRLGLVEVQYAASFTDKELYDWADTNPAYQRIRSENADPEREIGYDLGSIRATAFGLQFAEAVGITPGAPTPQR